MTKQLVLIGGGHAHMVTLHGIRQLVERDMAVTVIGPSPYHYYSGMGPGMLGGTYTAKQIRFAVRELVEQQGGTFIEDVVIRIEPEEKQVVLRSGGKVAYDVLSCNTGSQVRPFVAEDPGCLYYSVKPIENLLRARQQLLERDPRQPLTIAILGGGPSAAELAGNLVQLARDNGERPWRITVFCRSGLMAGFSRRVVANVRDYLQRQGVTIEEDTQATEVSGGTLQLADGSTREVGCVFAALGVEPSPLFTDSGIATGPDGGLLVNRFLQSVDHPEIFGGGDCIHYQPQPLTKVGVYAVRQNPVLFQNLKASLAGEQLTGFDPGGNYLLIFNLGCGYGVLQKGWLFLRGRLAFFLKDLIDRRFMNRFQEL